MKIEKFPGRIIAVEGEDYLYFGGTSYLGISTNDIFLKRFSENIIRWGTFYGSSRKANIQLQVYNEFEDYMANYIGCEKTLAISAGALAAKMVVEFLEDTKHKLFHVSGSHPAIVSTISEPVIHQGKLNISLQYNEVETVVIFLDAVLGSEVTTADLSFLDLIAPTKSVILVIDESHSFGIVGENGRGIFSSINHPIICEKIIVSSMGKAMGIGAGIIGATNEFISKIEETPNFVTSSGPSPAILQTFLDSEDVYRDQRKQLQKHLDYIHHNLNKTKYKFNPYYPLIYCSDSRIFNHCLASGIVITQFGYPSKDNLISRMVISAAHKNEDIERLVEVLNEFN